MAALDLSMPEAGHQVIVDHSDALHKSVANRGANKVETAALQVFTDGGGFRGFCGNTLNVPPPVRDGTSTDKLPDISVKTLELFLYSQKRLRVAYSRFDLEAITDDTRVGEKDRKLCGFVGGDLRSVKATERFAIRFTLGQDGGPTKAGLGAFQYEELEKHPIIVLGQTPFSVVVGDHSRSSCPGAAQFFSHRCVAQKDMNA
jgi:hypothetical protein